MKTLYFDCFAGISGDMLLGALCGLGVTAEALQSGLQGLGLEGWQVSAELVQRAHLAAWQVRVETPAETSHRHLSDILHILASAQLSRGVRERAAAIFRRLAEAEARVHGIGVEQVHFHEVGAWDAIIDITGACLGFELLGVEHFVCSPLHVGTGLVKMAHGTFPVPPPAVAELLQDAPIYADGRRGELVTPTGAAIVSAVCTTYGPMPLMRVTATGYGAGGREYEDFPNVLRLWLGETETTSKTEAESATQWETLVLLETNLDDVTPEVCGYVAEEIRAAGALECYITPVQMKKNRSGQLFSVLCRPAQAAALTALLVRETGTLGVRRQMVQRQSWPRQVVTVDTVWGPVDVKVTSVEKGRQAGKPEYEQCRRYALAGGVPLREVQNAAWQAWQKLGHAQEQGTGAG